MKNTPHLDSAHRLKVAVTGFKAFHLIRNYIKPTTRFIQVFGRLATRAKIDLDREQLRAMAESGALPMTLDLEDGYVILFGNLEMEFSVHVEPQTEGVMV